MCKKRLMRHRRYLFQDKVQVDKQAMNKSMSSVQMNVRIC